MGVFCRAKRENFFQNLTLGYMTKKSESDFFFSLRGRRLLEEASKNKYFGCETNGLEIFW
jgi:hypothetical protein